MDLPRMLALFVCLDSLDPALRRAGRFDREIAMMVPDLKARKHILQVLTVNVQVEDAVDYHALAQATPG
jgi:ribosome biogenesis ATPase